MHTEITHELAALDAIANAMDDSDARARLLIAIAQETAPARPPMPRRRRRWVVAAPAALVLAAAVLTAVALQPSKSSEPRATPLQALQLDGAAAAEVLRAAGTSAANAAGQRGARWIHASSTGVLTDESLRQQTEVWSDTERPGDKWILTRTTFAKEAGDEYWIVHVRNSDDDTYSVTMTDDHGTLRTTRREEHLDGGPGVLNSDAERLLQALGEPGIDVGDTIQRTIRGQATGGICNAKSCRTPTKVEQQLGREALVRDAIRIVLTEGDLSALALRGVYDTLADMEGARVEGTVELADGSDGIGISFPPPPDVVALDGATTERTTWVFERATGRLVAVIGADGVNSFRDALAPPTRTDTPGAGSEICKQEPAVCDAMRVAVEHVETDARWTGPSGTTVSTEVASGEPGSPMLKAGTKVCNVTTGTCTTATKDQLIPEDMSTVK